MGSPTCPECTNEVSEIDTSCTRCGASLVSDAPQAPPRMSVVREPLPPASRAAVIATRAATVVSIGWLCVLAVLAWMSYREGYVDTLVPTWNSLAVLGMVPIAVGVFRRRLWAQRWVLGTSALTALANVTQASRSNSSLLWVGAALLAASAIVMVVTRSIFRHDDAHRGTLAQLVAMAVLIGSVVVYIDARQDRGTERGRKAFAAEVQQAYAKAGPSVHVYIQGRTLVIESSTDTDEQIDAAAQQLHAQLQQHGPNAKAWVLGFDAIEITNGRHEVRLAPPDPP